MSHEFSNTEYRVSLLSISKKLTALVTECGDRQNRERIKVSIDGLAVNLLPTNPSKMTMTALLSGINYQLGLVVKDSAKAPKFGLTVVELQKHIEDTKRRINGRC